MTAVQRDLFRRRTRRPSPPSERKLHISVADALRWGAADGWIWSHFPAGEARTKATAGLLQRMGLQRGWPDFVLIDPSGRLHFIEMKSGAARLSPEQRAFAAAMAERGVEHAVARSFDQAITTLQRWGAISTRVKPQ